VVPQKKWTELPLGGAIPLPRYVSKRLEGRESNIEYLYTVFTAALLTVAKGGKNPSVHE
jgi:hypothetical protein